MVTPRSASEVVEILRTADDDGMTVKAVGSGHSFTPAAVTDGVLVRPDGPDPAQADRPGGRPGHRRVRDAAAPAQRAAGRERHGADQHGRHPGADRRRRDRHRHARHRPRLRLDRGPGGGAGAGAGQRRDGDLLADRERRAVPGRAPGRRGGRLRHRGDVPHRARVPAHGPRGADEAGRGAGRLRRPGRRQRALRVLLVPLHDQHQHQAQQPLGGPGRAAVRLPALDGRRVPVELGVRRGAAAGPHRAAADQDGLEGLRLGAVRAHLHRPLGQGVHLAAAREVRGDGVRGPAHAPSSRPSARSRS